MGDGDRGTFRGLQARWPGEGRQQQTGDLVPNKVEVREVSPDLHTCAHTYKHVQPSPNIQIKVKKKKTGVCVRDVLLLSWVERSKVLEQHRP